MGSPLSLLLLGVPEGLWVLLGGTQLTLPCPHTPARLCLPIQGSPETGRRPKGEQNPAQGWGLSPLLPFPCSPHIHFNAVTGRSGDQAEPPAGLVPGPGPGGLRWLAPEEEGPRGLHGPEVEAVLVCAKRPHALLVPPPQCEWGS